MKPVFENDTRSRSTTTPSVDVSSQKSSWLARLDPPALTRPSRVKPSSRLPSRSARRVFWIVDGGTIHRGQRAVDRLQAQFRNLTLVHLPKHASWINQIEIYFSILQRKALTPADFSSQHEVAERILGFQQHYQQVATPFNWKFTRRDLNRLMARSAISETRPLAEAA